MTRRRRATLARIVRRLTPSAERFAAAAAIYEPCLMLQLAATGALEPSRSGASTASPREHREEESS